MSVDLTTEPSRGTEPSWEHRRGGRWTPDVPAPVIGLLAALVGVMIGLFGGTGTSNLPLVTFVCAPTQVATFIVLRNHILRRSKSLCIAIGFSWLVYFTFRLLLTQYDRQNPNEQEFVRAAGDDAFIWAWYISTIALIGFALGAAFIGAGKPSRRYVPDLSVKTLMWFAVVGLLGRTGMVFGGINSGFIENIMSLYLLAFAALGYHSVTMPEIRPKLYTLVGVASSLGILTSFKEAAIIPIVALAVGISSAGFKIGKGKMAVLIGAGLMMFLLIQGNRVAFDEGDSIPLYEAPFVAFTTYDFEAGVTAEPDRTFLEANSQIVKGMSRRFGGVTSIVILYERVPEHNEHLGGRSLWQPAVSAVPVVSGYFDLEFRVLSMGRYFTQTFMAPDQPDNASSQAITMLGDFWLNFGDAGVFIGFVIWGLAIGKLDRMFPPITATRVGAMVYLGHILIGVERNVAFLGVNAAIRLTVLLLVLRGVARWGDAEGPTKQLLGQASGRR